MNERETFILLVELTKGGLDDFLRIKTKNPVNSIEEQFFALLVENKEIATINDKCDLFNKFSLHELKNIAAKCQGELTLLIFFIIVGKLKELRKLLYKSNSEVKAIASLVNACLNEIRFKSYKQSLIGNLISIGIIEAISIDLVFECKKIEYMGWLSKIGF